MPRWKRQRFAGCRAGPQRPDRSASTPNRTAHRCRGKGQGQPASCSLAAYPCQAHPAIEAQLSDFLPLHRFPAIGAVHQPCSFTSTADIWAASAAFPPRVTSAHEQRHEAGGQGTHQEQRRRWQHSPHLLGLRTLQLFWKKVFRLQLRLLHRYGDQRKGLNTPRRTLGETFCSTASEQGVK